MNGKGSKPRPIKNIKNFISNWDQINWKKNSISQSLGQKPKK